MEWLKLSVHEGTFNSKPLVGIDCCNLLDALQYCRKLLVHEVVGCGQAYSLTDGCEEGNPVDKEDIPQNHNVLVSRQNLWWDHNIIRNNGLWCMPDSLALQHGHASSLDSFGMINVGCGNWTVCHLIGVQDGLEVMGRRISNCSLEFLYCFSASNLARSESLFILFNCANQHQIPLPGVMVMQSIWMHHKVHLLTIWLVHGKYAAVVVAIIHYIKLLLHLFEQENISDGVVIKPHIAIVLDMCLTAGGEQTAIATDGHAVVDGPDGGHQF